VGQREIRIVGCLDLLYDPLISLSMINVNSIARDHQKIYQDAFDASPDLQLIYF